MNPSLASSRAAHPPSSGARWSSWCRLLKILSKWPDNRHQPVARKPAHSETAAACPSQTTSTPTNDTTSTRPRHDLACAKEGGACPVVRNASGRCRQQGGGGACEREHHRGHRHGVDQSRGALVALAHAVPNDRHRDVRAAAGHRREWKFVLRRASGEEHHDPGELAGEPKQTNRRWEEECHQH